MPNSDVRADAERWYARLKAPDCSAAERMEFQRWRSLPEQAAAFASTERLWQSLGQLAGRPDLEQLSQRILAETARGPSKAWPGVAIAATILAALVGGGFFWATRHHDLPVAVYKTEPAERSTIKLTDGSELVLNFATELDVRMNKESRHVTLRRGEALFRVARDSRRPFKVQVGDGEVTVLGTRFQVRKEGKLVAVTLLEGRIAVERPELNERAQLEPGDQVSFAQSSGEMRRRTVDPEVVASWTTGRLLFRSTPLVEALSEVNRYSQTRIGIADPTLADIPISGTFEVGDSASVVSALAALLPVQATKQGQEILLQRR